MRLALLEKGVPFKLIEAVAARDSVRAIAKSEDFYLERYAQFDQARKV